MSHARYPDPSTWRLQTSAGIPYKLVSRSGNFHAVDRQGEVRHTAQEVVLIRATQLAAFVAEYFPPPRRFGNRLIFVSKQFQGLPLFADSIAWRSHVEGLPNDPFGTDLAAPHDTYAPVLELTVNYAPRRRPEETDNPEEFLEVTGTATGEFINVGPAKGVLKDDRNQTTSLAKRIKEHVLPITKIVPTTDWDVRIPLIPTNFWNTILLPRLRSMLGHVNSTTLAYMFGAAPQTAMLVGYSYRERFRIFPTIGNDPFVEVAVKFLEKRIQEQGDVDGQGNQRIRGHNDFFVQDEGWKYLEYSGPGGPNDLRPVYPLIDMNTLFRF